MLRRVTAAEVCSRCFFFSNCPSAFAAALTISEGFVKMDFRIIAVLACSLFTFVATALPCPAADLEELREQWTQLNEKLDQQQEQLESGDTDPTLKETYRDGITRAEGMLTTLRKTAIDELADSPDSEVARRTLIGIMIYDAENGNDAEVLEAGDAMIAAKVSPAWFEYAARLDRLNIDQQRLFEEILVRQRETYDNDLPRVKLTTSKGEIVVELFENEAPNTVGNFISLVDDGYYNGKLFHRVLEGFVAQTGGFDSEKQINVTAGGPGYKIPCECRIPDARPHFTGSLSMAHAGRDTGGSQFFITFSRTDSLDGKHTVFGRVIEGADVLDQLERTAMTVNGRDQEFKNVSMDKIVTAEVIRKRDHVYKPRKVGDPEPTEEVAIEDETQEADPVVEEDKEDSPAVDAEEESAGEDAADDSETKDAADEDENEQEKPADSEPAAQLMSEESEEAPNEDAGESPNKETDSDSMPGNVESAGDDDDAESDQ